MLQLEIVFAIYRSQIFQPKMVSFVRSRGCLPPRSVAYSPSRTHYILRVSTHSLFLCHSLTFPINWMNFVYVTEGQALSFHQCDIPAGVRWSNNLKELTNSAVVYTSTE